MSVDTVIAEMHGYLHALQRLCGPPHLFWAALAARDAEDERSLKKYFEQLAEDRERVEIRSITPIDHVHLQEILAERIYSVLPGVSGPALKSIDWHLTEYYGLASTTSDKDGEFHPTVSRGAFLVSLSSPQFRSCMCIAVPIKGFFVITGLAIRA